MAGVELPWFDVNEGIWKSATLPPRPLEVLPSPEQMTTAPEVAASEPVETAVPVPAPANILWPAISAGLLVVWLATLGLWWQSRRPERRLAQASEEAPRRASNRRLLRQLRAACEANDARRAHALLLEWGALRLAGEQPASLGAFAARLPTDLAAAVAELERVLYGPSGESWDGRRLATALAEVDAVTRPAQRGEGLLLPLYR